MNHNRFLIAFLSLLFSVSPAISQEAVEPLAEQEPSLLPDQSGVQEPAAKKEKSPREEPSNKVLQDTMTAEEFRAAGLEKLSDEELKNLNAWLQGYRATTEKKVTEEVTQKVTEKVAKSSRAKLDSLQSRVAGTISGITGKSIIKLEDGTVWKQANADDRYRAQITDHPSAAVTRTAFGWKMRIAGMPEFYVDPVR